MFQILEMHEVHLSSVTNRIEKHGDEDVPAVSLGLTMTAANTILDSIDPAIRPSLYKSVDGQPDLPGMEPSTPALRCNSFDRHILTTKYEGWSLEVDDGIDETDPMVFGGTKVDKFQIEERQGGSVVLRFRASTSDVDAEKLGKLGMHVGQSIWIKLRAPEKAPEVVPENASGPDDDDIDPDAPDGDTGWPFPGSKPPADPPLSAGDIFANAVDDKPSNVVPVTVKKTRGKGLGTDADQAARQEKVLAEHDASATGAVH